MHIPQDLYDRLMALPDGTDISEYFKCTPGWDLVVTVGPSGAAPGTESDD